MYIAMLCFCSSPIANLPFLSIYKSFYPSFCLSFFLSFCCLFFQDFRKMQCFCDLLPIKTNE